MLAPISSLNLPSPIIGDSFKISKSSVWISEGLSLRPSEGSRPSTKSFNLLTSRTTHSNAWDIPWEEIFLVIMITYRECPVSSCILVLSKNHGGAGVLTGGSWWPIWWYSSWMSRWTRWNWWSWIPRTLRGAWCRRVHRRVQRWLWWPLTVSG